jgi:CheY-like chemotaxis protein
MPSVLVVDDDPDVRVMLETYLELEGFDVLTASNGLDALQRLRDVRPSVILLDLMMPVMDGFMFLDHVKHVPALAQVPIVVLTAKDLTDAERRVVNERTLLVLTKGAQPLSSLGAALAAIARRPAEKAAE